MDEKKNTSNQKQTNQTNQSVQNTLGHIIFVNYGCIVNLNFLGNAEVKETMLAVWVAQAMCWVAQAMWWEGCAGYVAVPGTFYIHSVVQLAILARFQAKLKFPSWTRVWQ